MRLFMLFAALVLALGNLTPATAQVSKAERNNLRYACEASGEISGAEVDARWCQCMNDYYLKKMTAADWEKYSRDYYALNALEEVQSEANSYTRHLQVASSHCISCKEKNYRGCLDSEEQLSQYNAIIEDLTTGQFQNIDKDITYKLFYTDFVRTYSRQCAAHVGDGVVQIYVYDDPVIGMGGSMTYIDEEFVNSYKRYAKAVEFNFIAEMVRKTGEAVTEQNPLRLLDIGFDVVSRDQFLNQRFAGKCTTPQVRALHTNLDRFDRGLTPRATLASTRAPTSQAEKKRAEIFAYTKASYERLAAAYATVRAKYEPLSCPRRQSEATQITTPRSPGGDNLKDLEGAWSGSFYGEPVEVAIWHVQHTPEMNPIALGILYFPQRECTMNINIRVYGTPARAIVGAYPNHRHPLDCQRVSNAESGKGGYGFNGDYALKDGVPTFLLTEIEYFLKDKAACSAPDPAFTPARASAPFRQIIADIQAAPDPNMTKPTPTQLARMTR